MALSATTPLTIPTPFGLASTDDFRLTIKDNTIKFTLPLVAPGFLHLQAVKGLEGVLPDLPSRSISFSVVLPANLSMVASKSSTKFSQSI